MFFRTAGEQRRIAAGFVQDGLDAGDQVWYLTDSLEPAVVLAGLREDGIPADRAVEKGQLVVRSAEQSYLAERRFDPDRMITGLHRAIDEALADGYAGFRVSGEMAWATHGAPGSERLLEYEARVNEVFATRPAATICQYQRQRFDDTTLAAIGGLHPDQFDAEAHAGAGGGPGLSITALPDGTGLRLGGEADLASRTAMHAALSALEGDVVRLQLAGLRFIDAGCLAEILALAQPPRRLILRDPPAAMLQMIELVGPPNTVEVQFG